MLLKVQSFGYTDTKKFNWSLGIVLYLTKMLRRKPRFEMYVSEIIFAQTQYINDVNTKVTVDILPYVNQTLTIVALNKACC